MLREINGVQFELDLREVIDSSLYYSGSFEPAAEKIIESVVRPGMVAIDIGANIGYHTFLLAKLVGPTGCVIAIEPTSYAFAKLRRNADLNPFQNIILAQVGLSDRDGGRSQVVFRSSYRLNTRDEIRTEEVSLVTLDSFVADSKMGRVDFLKIDVDGFEAKVFAGAKAVLRDHRPVIFFEFGPVGIRANSDDPAEILRFLWSLGYRIQTEKGEEIQGADRADRVLNHVGDSVNLLAIPRPEVAPPA